MRKWLSILLLIAAAQAFGQIRSGAAFLKMLPGSRQQSMANSTTALLDDHHAVFANPAAGGFLREWHWSASYTKWIADIYNASFLAGRNFTTPWSRRTLLNFGLLYQGIGEFNSAEQAAASVSANDWMLALNIGQPISFISEGLAFGTDVKYFSSKLAQYEAHAWVFDSGLLYRTPRFSLSNDANSLFPYGLVSAGVSITNLGQPLTFLRYETPLPRELRTGLAFYAGRHDGLQVQVSADYHSRRDEGSHIGVGAELNWADRFAVHGGYDTGNDLLEKYSFGFSFRLDSRSISGSNVLPGRNNALRLDFASMNEQEFFHHTYRGTISHFPVGPEQFEMLTPPTNTRVHSDSVQLSCQTSREPDLFDHVRYMVLMDHDSTKLAQKVELLQLGPGQYLQAPDTDMLLTARELQAPQMPVTRLTGGDYYWAMVAYDEDHHIRFAKTGDRVIAHFNVPVADLIAEDVTFEHNNWITPDDYHGILRARVSNMGQTWARDVYYTVYDSLVSPAPASQANSAKTVLKRVQLPVMLPGESRFVSIDWNTSLLGKHAIIVEIKAKQPVPEQRKDNNILTKIFYTVPKGTFVTPDTNQVITAITRSFALPIITEVCFDTNATQVKNEYLLKKVVESPIDVLSDRLVEHRHIKIQLQGFIDPNSEETDIHLADLRASALRDSMIHKGVRSEQIILLPGVNQTRRYVPANPEDARWVFEERRYVKVTTDSAYVPILFSPLNYVDVENIATPVLFQGDLRSALPLKNGLVHMIVEDVQDSIQLEVAGTTGVFGTTAWDIPVHDYFKKSPWINQPVHYFVQLTDSLGRSFKSYPRPFLPIGKAELREHTVAFPLQFNKADPLYSFYWANILESIEEILSDPNKRFRFNGHACAIGKAYYNLNLSRTRAVSFHDSFLEYIEQNYPDLFKRIMKRTDTAQGFGEEKPLGVIRSNGETVVIGENNLPTGRKLNRRIEINFYTIDKK